MRRRVKQIYLGLPPDPFVLVIEKYNRHRQAESTIWQIFYSCFLLFRWPSSIVANLLSLNGLFGVFEENGPSFETLHDPKSKSNGVFNASRGTIPTRRSTHGSRRSNLWIDFKILFPKYGEEPQQKSNLKHKWFKQYLFSKAFRQSFSIGAYCR